MMTDLGRCPLGPVQVDDASDDEVGDRIQWCLLDDELALYAFVDAGALGLLAVDEERVLVEFAGDLW